jgi:hypothetical protein
MAHDGWPGGERVAAGGGGRLEPDALQLDAEAAAELALGSPQALTVRVERVTRRPLSSASSLEPGIFARARHGGEGLGSVVPPDMPPLDPAAAAAAAAAAASPVSLPPRRAAPRGGPAAAAASSSPVSLAARRAAQAAAGRRSSRGEVASSEGELATEWVSSQLDLSDVISHGAPLTTQQLLFGRVSAAAQLTPSAFEPDGAAARARPNLPPGGHEQQRPASKLDRAAQSRANTGFLLAPQQGRVRGSELPGEAQWSTG